MDAGVEVRLVELRGLHPGWGPDRLAYRLAKEGFDPVPSRAAIGRALTRLGLIRPGRRRPAKRTYRRWERGRPMELWQMDVMGGVMLDDGTEVKAVTGIDDNSRFMIAVGLVERAPCDLEPESQTVSWATYLAGSWASASDPASLFAVGVVTA